MMNVMNSFKLKNNPLKRSHTLTGRSVLKLLPKHSDFQKIPERTMVSK